MEKVEYYVYYVHSDGYEDISWYSETIPNDDVSLEVALKHYDATTAMPGKRLTAIYRPSNEKKVIKEEHEDVSR